MNPRQAKPLWDIDSESGCWNWLRHIDKNGYGKYHSSDFRSAWAHRVVFERFVGPIPDGLDLDHLCRNRRCVNPSHLEPVTHSENSRRAWTHCKRGHLLSPENVMTRRDGRRRCKICRQEYKRAWRQTKRERTKWGPDA